MKTKQVPKQGRDSECALSLLAMELNICKDSVSFLRPFNPSVNVFSVSEIGGQ